MADIIWRISGKIGHITLNRPKALNALTYDMCLEIEKALDTWMLDDRVSLVLIDAEGETAFCAGGDIQEIYASGLRGDLDYGRRFWRDEYRLNAKIASYPKPYVAMMQGFTMGGGVGISCHGRHRVLCENSKIAMPETSIGLIPDVGGSYLLARANGFIGEYLAMTANRMQVGDALYAGFADYFVPQERWPDLKSILIETGRCKQIRSLSEKPPPSSLMRQQEQIDACFSAMDYHEILRRVAVQNTDFQQITYRKLLRNAPLAMACAVRLIRNSRKNNSIIKALKQEFNFTYRAVEQGDIIEGIRAAVIDKKRNPSWHHKSPEDVTPAEVAEMLGDLGHDTLIL